MTAPTTPGDELRVLIGDAFAQFLCASEDPWVLLAPDEREVIFVSTGAALLLERFAFGPIELIDVFAEQFYPWPEANGQQLCASATSLQSGARTLCLVLLRTRGLLDTERVGLEQRAALRLFQRLSSVISHDFNNLLMTIMSFTELFKLNLSAEQNALFISEIEKAIQRSAALLKRLQEASNPPTLRMQRFTMDALIQKLEDMLEPDWPPQVERVVELASSVPEIEGDLDQLSEVLEQLLVNAREAMPAGGVVTLRAFESDGELYVEVTDSGEGIPADQLLSVFEPFFSTRHKGRGGGLGLTRAFMIVHSHGGDLSVASTPGEGATFSMSLPIL